MPPAPVSRTHPTSSPRAPSAAAIASRIAWSSALRRAGLEIVSRRTPSAGRSLVTSPLMDRQSNARGAGRPGPLLEHDQRVALVDRLALLAQDLPDHARVLGL